MYYIHKGNIQGWTSSAQGLHGSMGMMLDKTYSCNPKPLPNQGTYIVFMLKFHCLALKGFYIFTTATKNPKKNKHTPMRFYGYLLCKDWLITTESKVFQSQESARYLRHRRAKRKLMEERLEKSKKTKS